MEDEDINESVREIDEVWNRAIYNARRAFEKTFEDEGYDSAYWTIKIISHSVSSDFKSFLETKTWDEYGNYKINKNE